MGDDDGPRSRKGRPRRRIWVQHVAVETEKLAMRIDAARARGQLNESQEVIAKGVSGFIDRARLAAFRDDPIPSRFGNWWRGTLVEAAYRNLHTARAQLIDLYDENELRAEIPMVVARADATLHRDDPRKTTVADLEAESVGTLRPRMRRIIGDTYEKLDLEHAQLRSFRNIVILAAVLLIVTITVTILLITQDPTRMPLCFGTDVVNPQGQVVDGYACPSSEGVGSGAAGHARAFDIIVVAVLGALGGALSATLSIRNLKGTSTPYDVPVALAFLKVPLGSLTAFLGLVAIQGNFVPGLSALDSQGQILAYALVFGFGQQALSRLLDQRAQTILEGLPGGSATEPTPPGSTKLRKPTPTEASVGVVTGTPVGGVVEEDILHTGDGVQVGEGVQVDEAGVPIEVVVADVGGGDVGAGTVVEGEVGAGQADTVVAVAGVDRLLQEPDTDSQELQFDQLRETGNERRDMTEEEEARLLEEEFGPPNALGIYGAPAAPDAEQAAQEAGPAAETQDGGS